jgi:signal transduction histidine kinase
MRLLFALLGYILHISQCCASQNLNQYHIRNFTDENGLPQNSVNQIIADSSGFLWLATEIGLVRYDGYKFKTFGKTNLPSPAERFRRFTNATPDQSIYAIAFPGTLIRLQNGMIFQDTLTKLQHLDLLNTSGGPRGRGELPTVEQILSMHKTYGVIRAGNGRHYVYHDQKLHYFVKGKRIAVFPFEGNMSFDSPDGEWSRVMWGASNPNELNYNSFFTVAGSLLYQVTGLGTDIVAIRGPASGGNRHLTLLGEIEETPGFESEKSKTRIIWNDVNQQAFAYLNGRFYVISFNDGKLHTRLILKDFDFNKNYIRTAYYNPSDGSIFLGSTVKGLFVITPKSFETLLMPGEKSDNTFYSQVPYGKSAVITPQGYVMEPGKAGKRVALLNESEPVNKFMMLKDQKGNLWLSQGKTLYKFSPDGKRVLFKSDFLEQPAKIFETNDGTVWIGSRSGSVSYLKIPKASYPYPEIVARLSNIEITWFLQDRPDRLWVGTSAGLYSLDLPTKKLTPVRELEKKLIRSVYTAENDVFWVTTYGDGLYLMENGKVTRLPSDQNGFLDYAHCILEDKMGFFWISSNKGIFKTRKKDLLAYAHRTLPTVLYLYYDRADGFLTNEFNGGCQPCGLWIGDGIATFPSLSGIVWFRPESVIDSALDEPFILEDFNVDGKEIPAKDTVQLPYDFGQFCVMVTGVYFGNSNNLHFQYNLKPEGEKPGPWLNVDKKKGVSVYRLAPGDYILNVRKITGFGNRQIQRQLHIRVQSAAFLSWGAIFAASLTIIGLLAGVVRWRTSYLTEQNRGIAKKVADQTHELSTTMDELRETDTKLVKQLQIQSMIVGVVSHDIRSPLKFLSSSIQKLYKDTQSEFPDFPYLNTEKLIQQSADQVLTLTENLLRLIKLMLSEGEIAVEKVNVNEILHAKCEFFTEIARNNETVIEIMLAEELIVETNRQMLDIIVHNLLDNAVKSTFKDTIQLSAIRETSPDCICIAVADTGNGMPLEIARWLGESGFIDAPGAEIPGVGFGLIVVKEFSRLLNIPVIAGTTNMGTIVQLLVPAG